MILKVCRNYSNINPERPPIVNRTTNEIAIGVSKVEPKHSATQLKTLTPVGTAINIVAHIKNISAAKEGLL